MSNGNQNRKRLDDPRFIIFAADRNRLEFLNSKILELDYSFLVPSNIPLFLAEWCNLNVGNFAQAIDALEDNHDKFNGLAVKIKNFTFDSDKTVDFFDTIQIINYVMIRNSSIVRFLLS